MTVHQFAFGICQCGCGQPTKAAQTNNIKRGHVKGQPLPFLHHHNSRWADRPRAEGMKWCNRCKQLLSLTAFSKNVGIKDGRSGRCMACNRIVCKQQREGCPENMARAKRYNREGLLRRHGITQADYDRMYEEQKGLCAICGKPDEGRDGARRLFIDHDHVTGKVRQLLCHHCNSGLGHFFDNPFRLKRAMDYLIQHEAILWPQVRVRLG